MESTPVSLRLAVSVAQAEVTVGDWIEANITLANRGEEKTEVIKPVLDFDSISFQIKTTAPSGKEGNPFVYSIITPSVYEHKKEKMAKVTLDKSGTPGAETKASFKIPAAVLGAWEITPCYMGTGDSVSCEPVMVKVIPPKPKKPGAEPAKDGEMIAKIETSMGTMTARFYFADAPVTVLSFMKLAKDNTYNNLIFHRIIKDFMIQGGDPKGNGSGNAGYSIKAEFNQNKHVEGVLSMARSQDNDSAGCQFFICLDTKTNLDDQYTPFGELIDGVDVLQEIGSVQTGNRDKPVKDVVIKSVTLEFKEAKTKK